MPCKYPYGGHGYGYPWVAISKGEEEIAMVEEQEKYW